MNRDRTRPVWVAGSPEPNRRRSNQAANPSATAAIPKTSVGAGMTRSPPLHLRQFPGSRGVLLLTAPEDQVASLTPLLLSHVHRVTAGAV